MFGRDDGAPNGDSLGRISDLYRRRPIVAWGSTAVAAGLVVAVIAVFALSGGGEPANVPIKCSVYDSDGSTVLSLKGKVTRKEADEGCAEVAAKLSGGTSYWQVGLPEPSSAYPEIACGLNAPAGERGTAIVEVKPETFGSPATAICGSLAHEGWIQFTHDGVVGPWQAEALLAEEAEEAAEATAEAEREERQAEKEREQEAWAACETRAQEKLEAEREAIQAEYAPLEKGSLEHTYEVQEEAEGLELEAEGRELHSIGRCQRRVEDQGDAESGESRPGVANPEGGT